MRTSSPVIDIIAENKLIVDARLGAKERTGEDRA